MSNFGKTPPLRYLPNPLNPGILHLRILIQPLRYRFCYNCFFVFFCRFHAGTEIFNKGVNFGAFGVKEIGNAVLFFQIW